MNPSSGGSPRGGAFAGCGVVAGGVGAGAGGWAWAAAHVTAINNHARGEINDGSI
jgi:hypothetical protein